MYKSTDLLRRKEPKRLWTLREGYKLAQELENLALSSESSRRRRKGRGPGKAIPLSPSSSLRMGAGGWQRQQPSSASAGNLEGIPEETSDAGGDDENAIPPPATGYRVIHSIPRRFGIFCTPGKSSMHGSSSFRASGSRAVRLSA